MSTLPTGPPREQILVVQSRVQDLRVGDVVRAPGGARWVVIERITRHADDSIVVEPPSDNRLTWGPHDLFERQIVSVDPPPVSLDFDPLLQDNETRTTP